MTRDELRRALLGKTRQAASRVVQVDGVSIEVRQPTIRQRSEIMRRSKAMGGDREKMELGQMQVAAIIECSYVPGSSERLFTEADREALLDAPTGLYDELANVAVELMNVDREEVAKGFATTPGDNSSSA